jgi:HK97 gp10 family phage protein
VAGGMKVQIKVVCNHFPECPGVMAKAISAAFGQLGPQLLSTMQSKTPVDTGALRDSETMSVGDKQLTLTANTDHCGFVEFGTRYMAAEPYMKPTMDGAVGLVGPAISSAASGAFAGIACS